jgi:hypothetical protein
VPCTRLAAIAIAVLLPLGCATTIPATDTTPPRVELRLSGPGIGTQTMSNPPLDNWEAATTPSGPYLRFLPGASYRFTVIVQDQGGVEQVRIALPEVLELESHEPPLAEVGTAGRHTEVVLFGNRAAPVNSLVLTGSFRAPESIVAPDELISPDGIYISAIGYDFGGRTGDRNRTTLILRAGLAAQ